MLTESIKPVSVPELTADILRHLKQSIGKDASHASTYDWRMSLALALRDRVVPAPAAQMAWANFGHLGAKC